MPWFNGHDIDPAVGGDWSGAENITRSAWFDGSADYLELAAPGSAATNRKEVILGGWCRRQRFGSTANDIVLLGNDSSVSNYAHVRLTTTTTPSDRFYLTCSASGMSLIWSDLFRDIEWLQWLVSIDTSQATAADRVQVFINGVDLGDADATTTYPTLNSSLNFGHNGAMQIGHFGYANSQYLQGSVAQTFAIQGKSFQQGDYASTDFGEFITVGTNGQVWAPVADSLIKTAVDTGESTHSYLLSSDIGDGTDDSVHANNFTPTSMSDAANGSPDSPSDPDVVFNALHKPGTTLTISEGGAVAQLSTGTSWVGLNILVPPNTKQYVEFNQVSGNANFAVGVCNPRAEQDASPRSSGFLHWEGDGDRYLDGSQTATEVSSWTSGDTIGLGVNTVDNQLLFYDNAGNLDATVSFGANVDGTYGVLVYMGQLSGGSAQKGRVITDEASLTHTLPTGYTALRQSNLPAPAVQGVDVFSPFLYTGNGSVGHALTGVGFAPDLAWLKSRNSTFNWSLFDTSRGGDKRLLTDATGSEGSPTDALRSFQSDGFTLDASATENSSGIAYLALCAKANGGATAANSDGDITTTVQAEANGCFSIITYTGNALANQDLGHGLGVEVAAVFFKNRTDTDAMLAWFDGMGAAYFNITNTSARSTGIIDATRDTLTFRVDNTTNVNGNGDDMLAYFFGHVPGAVAGGEYKGNGNTDGPVITTGFSPRIVLIKSHNVASWKLFDTARDEKNPSDTVLFPDTTAAESADEDIDILANGFKIRSASSTINTSNSRYSFLAIAEVAGGAGLPPIPGR